jgi:uncharacterized protein YwqG
LSSKTDLSALTVGELVQIYVETIELGTTVEHIGRRNRLFRQFWDISIELKARDPVLNCLRGLLDHPVREVRYDAAAQFKNIDRAVFKKILADLGKHHDRVGSEARRYLDRVIEDEKAGKDTYTDPVVAPQLSDPSAEAAWQPRHPPPAPMSLAQIRRQLSDTMSSDFAARVRSLARPAIGLWPQSPVGDLPVTASRLGGMPHAPPEWSWPTCENEPLFFLGQINCAELNGLPGAEKLPPSGLLAFFADHDALNGCDLYGEEGFAVFHWINLDQLAPAIPPIEVLKVLPLCALGFRPLIDLPYPLSGVLGPLDRLGDDSWAYSDLLDQLRNHGVPESFWNRISQSKLFGWPHWVQNEIDQMGSPDDPNGLRLLLQLDTYTDGKKWTEWGDAGTLYFLIRDADLAARRFGRCVFEMQCG